MQQWLRDDPGWLPAQGAFYPFSSLFQVFLTMSIIVSDVSGEFDLPEFVSSREDSTFSDLLWGQLSNVPTTFFSHVRTSIRRLLSQPIPNATRTYPEIQLVRDFSALTDPEILRLRSLLHWNELWGYAHWHNVSRSSLSHVNFYPYSVPGWVVQRAMDARHRRARAPKDQLRGLVFRFCSYTFPAFHQRPPHPRDRFLCSHRSKY